jgi:hypothetical protein
MNRYLSIAIATLAQALFAASTYAHPGHSLGERGPWHVVSSPYHLLVLALTGAGLWLAGRLVERRLPRRLLQGAGLGALCLAALLWDWRV